MEKERIFISWSGPRSKEIAKALDDWLPKVIQAVDPWMSEHDIAKGTRWHLELARGLEQTRFGLCCLTPENLGAPWLLFEAGAISKAMEETFVWTYLFDVEYADIEGPLAQFQHTRAEEEDTRKLVHAINQAVGGALRESDLNEIFTKWWEDLEKRLRDISPPDEEPKPKRSSEDKLEEVLILVRRLAQRPIEIRGWPISPLLEGEEALAGLYELPPALRLPLLATFEHRVGNLLLQLRSARISIEREIMPKSGQSKTDNEASQSTSSDQKTDEE